MPVQKCLHHVFGGDNGTADRLSGDLGAALQLQGDRLTRRLRGRRQGHVYAIASGWNPRAVELEAGRCVFQYDFEQDPFAPESSMRLIYAYPPVDRAHVFGVKFSGVVQQIGNNTPIQSRLTGQAGHGTRIGAAVADFNQDGLLDFYVCNYGDPNNGPGFDYFDSSKGFINKLFQNKGGGRFADVTQAAGLDKVAHNSFLKPAVPRRFSD